MHVWVWSAQNRRLWMAAARNGLQCNGPGEQATTRPHGHAQLAPHSAAIKHTVDIPWLSGVPCARRGDSAIWPTMQISVLLVEIRCSQKLKFFFFVGLFGCLVLHSKHNNHSFVEPIGLFYHRWHLLSIEIY